MKILVIADDKAGHIGQAKAVFDSIKTDKIFFSCKRINWFSNLFKDQNLIELDDLINSNLNVSVIVAVSSYVLEYAIFAKKKLSQYNKKVIIFYLMPPTNLKYKLKNIDYVCYHSYKDYKNYVDDSYTKYIKIDLPPSCDKNPAGTTQNTIMVIIGGDAKGVKFGYTSLNDMLIKVLNSKYYKDYNYNVLIFNSRRTSVTLDNAIDEIVKKNDRLGFINYKKDSDAKEKYLEYLEKAKIFVVTYESSSMVADVVSLPMDRKVFLYSGKNFNHQRYGKMLGIVENKKYGFHLDKINDSNYLRRSYNSNSDIVDYINKIIYK
jgi:mitochondrial fission protein ELM1